MLMGLRSSLLSVILTISILSTTVSVAAQDCNGE